VSVPIDPMPMSGRLVSGRLVSGRLVFPRTICRSSKHFPVLRLIDDLPRRNGRCRLALRVSRARPRFDRQDDHSHRKGHPEDEREPRCSGSHVLLPMPTWHRCAPRRTLERKPEGLCELRYTRAAWQKKEPRVSGAQCFGGTSNVRTAYAVPIDNGEASSAIAFVM
jgi:hypothetical protein